MSRIKLDLSKFKHVKTDDKFTTLQHKDGHILTMAHGGLSDESKQQLDALRHYSDGAEDILPVGSSGSNPKPPVEETPPKKNPPSDPGAAWQLRADQQKRNQEIGKYPVYNSGGKVAEKPSGTNEEYKRGGQNTPVGKMQRKDSLQEYKKSEGPKLQKLAEGGQPQGPCLNPNCKSHGKSHPNCKCYSAMAKGGEVQHVCQMKGKHYQDCEYYAFGEGDVQPPAAQDSQQKKSPPSDYKNDWSATAEHSKSDASQRKAMYAEGSEDVKEEDRSVPHEYMKDDAPESQEAQDKGIDKEVEDAEAFANPQQPQAIAAPMANDQQPDQGIAAQSVPAQGEPAPQESPETPVKPTIDPTLAQQGAGEESSNPIQRFVSQKQQLQNDYLKEDQAWAQDLANGHIKPLTYQSLFAHNEDGSEKSTLGKLGTIFGMLLSGAGSGLSHQPNAMMQRMQQTINNDLDAQKTSKQDAINYLRLSQQHEMNKANMNHMNAETAIAANTMARMKTTRAALHSLTEKVSAMPPGSAQRQQAEANLAMLNQYVQNDNMDLADRAATAGAYYKMLGMGNSAGDNSNAGNESAFQSKVAGERLLGPDGQRKAEMDIATHIPGVPGQASRPVPEDIRQRLQAQTVLDNKGRDVLSYVKQHTGTWNPQTRAVASQKIEEMKNFYNDSIKGGALTQGRLGWYDEQFAKHPTDILNQLMGSTAKLGEMVNSNKTRRDLELKGLGFPIQPGQSNLKEGATGTHNGKPTIVKNGKWEYK